MDYRTTSTRLAVLKMNSPGRAHWQLELGQGLRVESVGGTGTQPEPTGTGCLRMSLRVRLPLASGTESANLNVCQPEPECRPSRRPGRDDDHVTPVTVTVQLELEVPLALPASG